MISNENLFKSYVTLSLTLKRIREYNVCNLKSRNLLPIIIKRSVYDGRQT